MPLRHLTTDGYTRSLIQEGERTLIRTVCDYCGVEIVGSVPQLKEQEDRHRVWCKKRKSAAAFS